MKTEPLRFFHLNISRLSLLVVAGVLLMWGGRPAVINAGAESPPGSGAVSGTISLYRTKVKTKGVKSDKEVVVYLERMNEAGYPPVSDTVAMDQQGLVFIPHVLPVQVGTTVEFLNSDSVEHNVYFLSETSGKTLDLGTWPQGVSVKHTFKEKDVVIILCKLHLEMAAYVVIMDTPYYTTAVLDGDSQQAVYKIDGVPPGRYKINTWHKKLLLKGGPQELEIKGGREVPSDLVITKRKYAK